MAELDPCDRLLEACADSNQYPYTLLKKAISGEVLEGFHHHLQQSDATLFDRSRERLLLWEMWPGEHRFQATELTNPKEVREHLIRDEKDPKCRHIFIESDNSRAPLNCSASTLKTLLTFHQVDPSFLDALFTFGAHDEPPDAGLSYFHSDDALAVQDRLPFLASLGRSGRELRHSFLLRTVERTSGSTDPWSVRQVAVYHSFDVLNGRTVWITVKGNDYFERRIVDDTTDLPVQRGAIEGDVGASFEASLATHLIFFHWCEQNWRWFIRDIEERIRKALVKARTLPVDSEPHFAPAPQKTVIEAVTPESFGGSYVRAAGTSASSEKYGIFERVKSLRRPPSATFDLAQVPTWQSAQSRFPNTKQVPEGMLVLNMFNYKELQTLSRLAEQLEEVTLVVQLDIGVLQDMDAYYQRLTRSDDIGDNLKRNLDKSVSRFSSRVQEIIRSLETKQAQLVSLRKRLDEGKALYENLLQLRSLQLSRIFAEHGHRSAIVMQDIAHRTERETVSMHTITVVTLLFLPATFLSSFFQCGVLQWKETPEVNVIGEWLFRAEVFKLFISVCIPMTAITLFCWLVVNYMGRKRKRAFQDAITLQPMVRPAGLSV